MKGSDMKKINYPIISVLIIIMGVLIGGCVGEKPKHTVTFDIEYEMQGPLVGAEVIATPASSTTFSSFLGGGSQSGITDSMGRVVFDMSSSTEYNIVVKYQGEEQSYQIYPSSSFYVYGFFPKNSPFRF